jgi:uncharacterized protein
VTAHIDHPTAPRHSHLRDRLEGATGHAGATRLERALLGLSLCVIVAHAADLAYRDYGVALATGIGAGALACAVLAFIAAFTGGRTAQVVVAGTLGLAAFAVGMGISGVHIVIAGASGADYTGVVLVAAGIALTTLAIRAGLRGQRKRRWLVLIPIAAIYLQWVILPVGTAGMVTSAPHPSIAGAATLGIRGARDVTFSARDGTRLAGWYVPASNGGAIILMHGSHNTRADTVDHLHMLHRAGYAVLAFDARGHGQSEGQTNAAGWDGDDDIAGAVTFLRRQPGIDPHRIAALGLSMGAEQALRASADGIPLGAVVADGAGASTMGDQRLIGHGITQPVFLSVTWLTMRATELASGDTEPAPLESIVGRIRAPVFLIASNAPDEHALDLVYEDRMGAIARLWYLSDTGHTLGLSTHPSAYQHRVTDFLRAALAQ